MANINEIIRLRKGKKTYQKIGDSLSPKITRERVRQILKYHAPELLGYGIVETMTILKKCLHCGRQFRTSRVAPRTFCKNSCLNEYPKHLWSQ